MVEASWLVRGMRDTELFSHKEENRKMLRRSAGVPGREDPHTLNGPMNARQDQFMSVIPVSLYAPVIPPSTYTPLKLPLVKLNGGGCGKQIFSPPRHPSASLHYLNLCLEVLLCLHWSTFCSQIDRMCMYRVT